MNWEEYPSIYDVYQLAKYPRVYKPSIQTRHTTCTTAVGVDEMGVDEMGVDEMGVDEMGGNTPTTYDAYQLAKYPKVYKPSIQT